MIRNYRAFCNGAQDVEKAPDDIVKCYVEFLVSCVNNHLAAEKRSSTLDPAMGLWLHGLRGPLYQPQGYLSASTTRPLRRKCCHMYFGACDSKATWFSRVVPPTILADHSLSNSLNPLILGK